MGPKEKYLFDLWGYVNIEGVLRGEELTELNALIDAQNYPDPVDDDVYSQRFGGFLNWENDAFRKLLNHPHIMPFLAEIVGPEIPIGSCLRYLDDRRESRRNAPWRWHALRSSAVLRLPKRSDVQRINRCVVGFNGYASRTRRLLLYPRQP